MAPEIQRHGTCTRQPLVLTQSTASVNTCDTITCWITSRVNTCTTSPFPFSSSHQSALAFLSFSHCAFLSVLVPSLEPPELACPLDLHLYHRRKCFPHRRCFNPLHADPCLCHFFYFADSLLLPLLDRLLTVLLHSSQTSASLGDFS